MQGTESKLIPIDSEIERTTRIILRVKKEVPQVTEEVKLQKVEMTVTVRQILGDYCRRIDADQISLGFKCSNTSASLGSRPIVCRQV